MANPQFSSLVKDLERLIGITIDAGDDESIAFAFDDDIGITMAPDEGGNVVLDADIARFVRDDTVPEVARFLLHRNYAVRSDGGSFAAVASDGRIVLTCAVPIGQLDAQALSDRFESLLGDSLALRESIDVLSAVESVDAPPAESGFEALRV